LDGTEDYIVLACDGMWDGISQGDVPQIVYDHLQKTKGDKSSVAKMLVEVAKENGSTDNITVVIVFLRDEIAAPSIPPVFSFDKISSSQGDRTEGVDGEKDNNNSSGKGNNSDSPSSNGDKESDGNVPKEGMEDNAELQEPGEGAEDDSSKHDHIPLPVDRVLKKEAVFIISDAAPQNLEVESKNSLPEQEKNSEIKSKSPLPKQRKNLEVENKSPLPKQEHSIPKEAKPLKVDSTSKDITPSETALTSTLPASAQKPSGNCLPGEIGLSALMTYLPNQGSTISEFRHGLQLSSKPSSVSNSLAPLHEDLPIVSNYVIQDEMFRKKDLGKKKPKRNKNPKSREQSRDGQYVVPRRGRKKNDGSTPVVWAFTGKNAGSVKNHKLSSLKNSQNSSRIILTNILNSGAVDSNIPSQPSSDIKFLEKISKSKHFSESEPQNSEELPMPHTIFDYPLSTFTASSNFSTKSTSSSKTKSSLVSQPKTNPKTVPAFHQSWRPRKLSKINTPAAVAEPPPTPFSNVKIHPSSEFSE
jgi:protein phosphatase 1E